MRHLLRVCLIVCLSALAHATATVTGNLQDLTGTNVTSRAFVRFTVRNCGGNQPRVNGVTVLAPIGGSGEGFYKDFVPDANGNISGTIYENDEIECGGQTSVTWYGVVIWRDGKPGPEVPYSITSDAFDLTTAPPMVSIPPNLPASFVPGVSSMGLTLPPDFSVSGSPITGVGGLIAIDFASTPTGTGGFMRQDSATATTQFTAPKLIATGSSLAEAVEGSAPSAPTVSGHWFLYPKSGSGFCEKNFAGTETCFNTGQAVPVTTKGDIYGFSSVPARLPVGTDGQLLSADSTQTLGLKWIAGLTNPMLNPNEMIYGGAAGVPTRLAVGGAGTLCLTETAGGVPGWNACSGTASTIYSALTNPVAALALTMAVGDNTQFTYTGNTGSSNLFSLIDATGNTGTGAILEAHSVGTSIALPVQFTAQGTSNGVKMDSTGNWLAIGAGKNTATHVAAGGILLGSLLASVDNTADIGAAGATRPRTGYFGTSVVTPGLTLNGVVITGTPSAGNVLEAQSSTAASWTQGPRVIQSKDVYLGSAIPATGLQNQIFTIPQNAVNCSLQNSVALLGSQATAGSPTWNVAKCTANCTTGTPTWTDIYTVAPAITLNATRTVGGTPNTTSCTAGDVFKIRIPATGTGEGQVTISLQWRVDASN